MSLTDQLAAPGGDQPDDRRTVPAAPKGFEPGVVWDGSQGTITTRAAEAPGADWDEHLRKWGFDPAAYRVLEPVRMSTWESPSKGGGVRQLWAYRARIVSRTQAAVDVDRLCDDIRRHKPPKTQPPSGELAFLACSGDLQLGKPDGDGTEGTVRRFLDGVDASARRLKELRKAGRSIGTVYLPWLGDCIESVGGHYAMQTFGVELTLTEQVRVLRRLLLKQVQTFAPLAERVIVPCVPGNHDEAVRTNGKASTAFSDSWAIEGAAAVADALKLNGDAYGHVSFVFPQGQELTLTLDMAGCRVGLAHGHQFGRDPVKWWANQAHGMQPIGDSTLLLAGHLHHLKVNQDGAKTFMQIPALDGGSTWWRHTHGSDAPPGVVTLTVGDGRWGDLAIL